MAEVKEKEISPGAVVAIGLGLSSIAVLGLAALAFTRPPTPPGKARLYGTVTDAETGEALSGVLVTLDELEEYTDFGGNYLSPDLETGAYVLQFSKEGYETATADLVLVEGNNELNVKMTPVGVPSPGEGIIWGFVTDSLTGEAVPDVKITLNGLVRYTAGAGQYEIRHIACQRYRIQFSKEGYETVTRDVVAVVYEIEGVSGRLDISLHPIIPAKPTLVYARPAQAQVASGETAYINYKVGIPDITAGNILMFLFPLEGVRCWTPFGCANIVFRAGATAGYYEGSAAWYVKYQVYRFTFANIPPGVYRLLSTCELYRDGTLVKTYWRNVDTGQTITVV